MSYYDWQHLIKRLTWTPVVQDTVENTKALSITPVDDIHTAQAQIKIPASTFTRIEGTGSNFNNQSTFGIIPLIIGQFNYSTGQNLTILDWNNLSLDVTDKSIVYDNTRLGSLRAVALAIRFRTGTAVTRYLFAKTATWNGTFKLPTGSYAAGKFPKNYVAAKSYSGQTIPPEFVIEVWQTQYSYDSLSPGVVKDIYLTTGAVIVPVDYAASNTVFSPSVIVDGVDLQNTLPEVLPIMPNANGPWNSN